MPPFDPLFALVLSDFLINLSAGWAGAAIIVSPLTKPVRKVNPFLLTTNITSAIVSLVVAYLLRKGNV